MSECDECVTKAGLMALEFNDTTYWRTFYLADSLTLYSASGAAEFCCITVAAEDLKDCITLKHSMLPPRNCLSRKQLEMVGLKNGSQICFDQIVDRSSTANIHCCSSLGCTVNRFLKEKVQFIKNKFIV